MKKLTIFVAALVLALGLAQCKKQETPDTPNAEYNWVHINMKVNGGERYNIDPNMGTAGFTDGDSIYVSNGGKYRGVLTYSNGTFTGDLAYNDENPMSTVDSLHFYFFGGTNLDNITFNKPTLFQTTLDGVDISVQSETLPILSYGKSTTPYSNSSTTYSTTLENQCALVEFTTNSILKEWALRFEGINNRVNIDFANHTFTPTHEGNITLYTESPTRRWAILLPNEDSVTVNVNATGYDNIDIPIPPVKKNDYLHGENAVSFELTATDADKPLTMMMMFPGGGTIRVINPPEGMQYEKFVWTGDNNYYSCDKQAIPSDVSIEVNQNDKVSFYGNGTSITDYSNTHIVSTNHTSVSGNIMSLVDENSFATATSMAGASFAGLFSGDGFGGTSILEVSSLLLPATTLSENCYSRMFAGCSELSGGPAELPALTLAPGCYSNMFKGCNEVMWAQTLVLPATELVDSCYFNMFDGCNNLYKLTCLATTIKGTDCTTNWLNGVANTSPFGVPTFTKAKGVDWWTTGPSGIPNNWTVNEY